MLVINKGNLNETGHTVKAIVKYVDNLESWMLCVCRGHGIHGQVATGEEPSHLI